MSISLGLVTLLTLYIVASPVGASSDLRRLLARQGASSCKSESSANGQPSIVVVPIYSGNSVMLTQACESDGRNDVSPQQALQSCSAGSRGANNLQ